MPPQTAEAAWSNGTVGGCRFVTSVAQNRPIFLVHKVVVLKGFLFVLGLLFLPVTFYQLLLQQGVGHRQYLLSLHWRHKVLVLPVDASSDTIKILSYLFGQKECLGMLLVEFGHQSTERALVLANEARVTLHRAVPAEPSRILVGIDDRLVVHVVKGLLAAVTAYKIAITAAKRAEVIILFLDRRAALIS